MLSGFKNIYYFNFEIIDESINALRYQYVMNFFHSTKFKFMIEWEPVISNPVDNLKHITDVYTNNVESDSKVDNDIHKATPCISSFALGVLSDNVSDSLTPVIEYLASIFLPSVPEEMRVICFWIIVLLVALKKPDQ